MAPLCVEQMLQPRPPHGEVTLPADSQDAFHICSASADVNGHDALVFEVIAASIEPHSTLSVPRFDIYQHRFAPVIEPHWVAMKVISERLLRHRGRSRERRVKIVADVPLVTADAEFASTSFAILPRIPPSHRRR